MKKLFILISFLNVFFIKAQTSQTFTNSATFIVPCGVTSITVQCWGGGGAGGGGRSNSNAAGGGGAGGAYSYSVMGVTSGQNIAYIVGAGGVGSTSSGNSGSSSSFGGVIASGGSGGTGSNTSGVSAAGATGSSAGSVGSTIYAGGSGGTGSSGTSSGGGGGAAGTTGSGGNGSGATAGIGATGGGNGGAGVTSAAVGANGNFPGGGGGGGLRSGSSNAGGNGGNGQIVISYDGATFSADAGVDQTINGCTTSTAAISGNTVAATTGSWTCVSGCTGVSFGSTISANTIVSGLSATAILRWSVTSASLSCTSPDDMQITVNNSPSFSSNAGSNQTFNACGTTTAAVSGNTATATTGSWTCVSGCTGVTITTPTSANTTITGLTPSTVVVLRWTLTSTFNSGCNSASTTQITVNYGASFTSNAGSDKTLVSCSSSTSTTLSGNIVAATTGTWSCISGCTGISITTPTLATSTVTGLTPNSLTTIRWTLSSTTSSCISVDNMNIIVNCPITNDNPCSAIAAPVNSSPICTVQTNGSVYGATNTSLTNNCGGNADDDVWFSFVANSTSQDISLTNVAGSTTDLYHSVYTGLCSSLNTTELICSDPNNSTTTGLTAGTTYFVRVYTKTNTSGQNTVFSLCIKPTPPPPTNTTCAVMNPVCSDTPISFQAQNGGGSAASGPDYGCLGSTPNPTWFYLEVGTAGNLAIDLSANSDIDFALWGPYNNLAQAKSKCTNYPSPVDCSYSNSNIEQANITSAVVGDFYVLLVTNYASIVQTINLKSSDVSTGSTNCSIVPTPIELISFDATITEDRKVRLNWSTATETNNDYFEIQHSNNAYSWEVLSTQKGAGSTTMKQNYQLIDNYPYQGLNYYCLKQIDFDKTSAYSNIVSVDFNALAESIINVHPNPTKDVVYFDWKTTKVGNITIELVNYKGETVYRQTKRAEEGINHYIIDVNEFSSGIYLLKATNENSGKTSLYKLMKQ